MHGLQPQTPEVLVVGGAVTRDEFCVRAATEWWAFWRFRRHPAFDTVSQAAALQLARGLGIGALKQAALNDRMGSPRLGVIDWVTIAPDTARFLKIAHTIGGVDGARVCEIGAGYGGLCRIIDSFSQPRSYTLVDTPGALALAARYLGQLPIRTKLIFKTYEQLDTTETYDLAIGAGGYYPVGALRGYFCSSDAPGNKVLINPPAVVWG